MRDRQASAYQYSEDHGADTDIERRAEEAAYKAGKSLEDWLHDIILEQSAPVSPPRRNLTPQDDSLKQTKDAVLESLAERVKALETGQSVSRQKQYAQQSNAGTLEYAIHQAAENIGHNYDEDARILIEGIRARARAQGAQSTLRQEYHSRSPRVPSQSAPSQPAYNEYHDTSADRLTEMLNTIERLEQKLNEAPRAPSYGERKPATPNQAINTENAARLARIEQKLEGLEVHLAKAERQNLPDHIVPVHSTPEPYAPNTYIHDMPDAPWDNGTSRQASPSRRKAAHQQGRKALQRAMEAIADKQNNKQADSTMKHGYVPKDRSSHPEIGYHEANQHFLTLIKKIEELQRGTPDANDLNALKAEFTHLRRNIVETDAGGTKKEVSRLRELIQNMQATVVSSLDDSKLKTLEADINRIAEFLLLSPDLTKLPDQAETIVREISRISDGLLAVSEKNVASARDSGDMIVGRIEGSLKTLRDDIVTQLHNKNDAPSVVSDGLESRLSELRAHIDGVAQGLSGQVSKVENRMVYAAEKLEALGQRPADDPQAVQRLEQMEAYLLQSMRDLSGQMKGLENRVDDRDSGTQIIRELEGSLDKIRDDIANRVKTTAADPAIALSAVTDLENRMSDMRDHIDTAMSTITGKFDGIESKVVTAAQELEKLGDLRRNNSDVTQQMVRMEERLMGAAKRLEQASVDAARSQGDMPSAVLQMPIDALTSKDLKEELDKLASHLSEGLKTLKQSDTLNTVTNDTLKSEFDTLGTRLSHAIETGQQATNALTQQQLKYELGGLADHLTERLKVTAPVAVNSGITDNMLKNKLDGLAQQVTHSVAAENSRMVNHIDSAISKLQMLAETQKNSFENIAQETAEKVIGMTPSANNGLQDDIKGLVSSSEDLSSQTQSSFESIQGMLANVIDRLNALEEVDVNLSAADDALEKSDGSEPQDDAVMTLSSEMQLHDDAPVKSGPVKPVDEKFSYSTGSDEAIMERMRAHVKARHPNDEPIEPGADDIPLKPGAGKPASQPVMRDEGHYAKGIQDTNKNAEENPASTDFTSRNTSQEEVSKKSKADFIAAARRAAQLASIEQVNLAEQEEQAEVRSTLSVIRERISAAGKMGKREKARAPVADELPAEAIRSADPLDTGDVESAVLKKLSNAQGIDEELLFDTDKRGTRVKILSALLGVVVIGTGYFALKDPISGLVAGLSQNPNVATQTTSTPASSLGTPPSNTTVKRAPDALTLPAAPVISDDEANLEVHTSLEHDDRSIGDIAALDITGSGIDRTTTQAISPANDAAVEPVLDPILRKALEGLPDEGISTKLADALIAADASAFIEVARRFGQGDIFPRDIQKSAFWYEQAANKDNAVAQYRLGTLYEEGIGVAKDADEARRWYIRATDNGNALAMHNIAVLYTEGAFGEVDFKEAFKWFERGAAYGVKDSQFNLGILYVRGLGVEASLPQAYKWFDIVAKGGDPDAAEKRDDVAKALTPDQLEIIKKESAAWKKKDWIVSANVVTPPPSYWRDGTELGAAVLHKDQPNLPNSSDLVKEAQVLLSGLGFDAGRPDGVLGKQTKEAVRSFEYELGLPQTGKINQKLVELLKAQKI